MNGNNDPGKWRKIKLDRPWYSFALSLVPKKRDEQILDLGAGNGEFALFLKKLGKEVVCLDNSPLYIQKLKKLGFKAILCDLNQAFPFKNQTFEGIVCLEVIEHIVQAEQLLQEVKRVLKKRGWLLISSPNISWFGYRILALIGKIPFKEGCHLRYFNYHSLQNKLKEAGLFIKKEACFTPIPYLNRIKQFWLPVRFWQNLLAQDLIFLCRKN